MRWRRRRPGRRPREIATTQHRETGRVEVVEHPEAGRFELDFPGGQAFAVYRSEGDRIVVTHTEVPPAFNGRGIGSQLAEGIFEIARASGRRVVPRCSFIADWARRHPQYGDVLA